MKNREYYKDEIYAVACQRDRFAVNRLTKKIEGCFELSCKDCLFNPAGCDCGERALRWLEQEHVEPLLNDAERQYLEAVIRPFKDRAIGVTKYKFSNDYAWLYIDVAGVTESTFDGFSLPAFRKDSAYLGMKFDKEYTLEELGLFENENGAPSGEDRPNDVELKATEEKIAKAIKRHDLLIEARRALETYRTNK